MLLVIYGHFLEPIYPARPDLGRDFVTVAFQQWQVIYSFHMMLFFFVSGVVNRSLANKPWQDAARASLRLLALAWVVHLLGVVVALVTGTRPEAFSSVPNTLNFAVMPLIQGNNWSVGVLWFLTSLCCVQFLAYLCLRIKLPPLAIVGAALLGTAMVVWSEAANPFMFRTWMPGLCFFALGYVWSRYSPRVHAVGVLVLCIAVVVLAPLNGGCTFTFHETCEPGFGVRVFAGGYGYLPLFFVSALVGTLAVVSAGMLLAKTSLAESLAYVGRNSLELFIINGFVATFLPPVIAGVHWRLAAWWFYPAAFIVVISLHLAALRLLRTPLSWINVAAAKTAAYLTSVASTASQAMAEARAGK